MITCLVDEILNTKIVTGFGEVFWFGLLSMKSINKLAPIIVC